MTEPNSLSEGSCAAKEVFVSVKNSIAELCAKGRTQYAHKNYVLAADLYSRATELQAELNGEMNPENAEILFLYGRTLFKLGQSKSDVLGGRPGGDMNKHKVPRRPEVPDERIEDTKLKIINDNDNSISASSAGDGVSAVDLATTSEKKPLFQFTGDEDFDESGEDEAQDEEEDEDELAAAFDILDLAKVLFRKKLEDLDSTSEEKEKTDKSSIINHYKERLADTHDLLAEISLENERFPAAVSDCRDALSYKQELYSEDRSVIAEAHFKLSLALEFASITNTAESKIEGNGAGTEIDQNLRDEAIKEMEAAIKSTNLKLQAKESELKTSVSTDESGAIQSQVSEVKEMLAELRNRLEELRSPAIDLKSVLYGPLLGKAGTNCSDSSGNAPGDIVARIEDAKKTATDVTSLVRKKAKVIDSNANTGKRKAEDEVEGGESKRAKVESADKSGDAIANEAAI